VIVDWEKKKGKAELFYLSFDVMLKIISKHQAHSRLLVDVASSLFTLIVWSGISSERTGGSRDTKKTGAGTSGRAVAAAIL
jgi:hypothetical protein